MKFLTVRSVGLDIGHPDLRPGFLLDLLKCSNRIMDICSLEHTQGHLLNTCLSLLTVVTHPHPNLLAILLDGIKLAIHQTSKLHLARVMITTTSRPNHNSSRLLPLPITPLTIMPNLQLPIMVKGPM